MAGWAEVNSVIFLWHGPERIFGTVFFFGTDRHGFFGTDFVEARTGTVFLAQIFLRHGPARHGTEHP